MLSFYQFMERVGKAARDYSQRKGQALSNELKLHNPELYDRMMLQNFDPFYFDSSDIEYIRAVEFIRENWS